MTDIRLENIAKNFGPNTVIRGLDLTIKSGEFFTIVGPSGCGKTTLLNIIAGIEEPSEGAVLFDGSAVTALPPRDRDVAMVFQSYALYPHMTAFENIAFPLLMRRERKEVIAREVARTASLLGIEGLLDRKPRQLSGGQRQRVALGRAIVRRPRVFLMDEPLSNLDARLRIEMRAELKKLHRELGITTIYVTHDQGEALALSDRVAVLDKGELQQCDAPRDVYRRPANVFVAGFIGSPPMNLFRCIVARREPLELRCNGTQIVPQPGYAPPGDEVIVGIRPEDVILGQGAALVTATVSVTEPAGPVVWIETLWRDLPVMVAAGPETEADPGGSVNLHFPPDRLSLFDAASGRRLERTGTGTS